MGSRQLLRPILLAAVVVGAAVAGAAAMAAYKSNQDDDSAAPTTTTLPETTTTTEADTTTTTAEAAAAPADPAAATTTTTAGPGPTTTTTTTPGATTTVRTRACGTGTAVVTFEAREFSTSSSGTTFRPTATVANKVDQPIEVDELGYALVYSDGSRSIRFPTGGTVIQPGGVATFVLDPVASTQQYTSARLEQFSYFTTGRRSECRVSI